MNWDDGLEGPALEIAKTNGNPLINKLKDRKPTSLVLALAVEALGKLVTRYQVDF